MEGGADEASTLLIVEDDAQLGEAVARLCRRYFARVVLAASFAAGEAAVAAERFDVVVSDFQLGDGDGVALLGLVAARWPRCRRVLYSGDARALAGVTTAHAPAGVAAAHAVVDKSEPVRALLAAIRADARAGRG